MTVAMCTLVRDEARPLREWLHHHSAVGVSRVFVYDDNSTDATAEVLAPYEASNFVTRVPWPTPEAIAAGVVCDGGESGSYSYCQTAAFNDCLGRTAAALDNEAWVLFLDTDELVMPRPSAPLGGLTGSIQSALRSIVGGGNCSVVLIPGALFGSRGRQSRLPSGAGVVSAYTRRAAWTYDDTLHKSDFHGRIDYERAVVKPKAIVRLASAAAGGVTFDSCRYNTTLVT